ncbi:unnamed protein product [Protopolystoma xenopodis]|uniref:RRM domain-containing protein n=1 Tax=Protopolystoma xenopodis TaxID=117903 RepID=A0A448X4B8_9PLAT|nr:unnamed protein product [Protopolystoma xenopodis]
MGSGSGNRYVPPQMRGTAGASMTGGKRVPEGFTVRVTNLPPDMQIDDLKAVFALYGQIIRIFPAKDKVTQMNRVRGFAFISYASFDHAQAAVTNLDGFRYNHVVLKVDWAK